MNFIELQTILDFSLESRLSAGRSLLMRFTEDRSDGPFRMLATYPTAVYASNGSGSVIRIEETKCESTQKTSFLLTDLGPRPTDDRDILARMAAGVWTEGDEQSLLSRKISLIESALDALRSSVERLTLDVGPKMFADLYYQLEAIERFFAEKRTINDLVSKTLTLKTRVSRIGPGKLTEPVKEATESANVYLRGLHIGGRVDQIPANILAKAIKTVRAIETLVCFAEQIAREKK